MNSVAYLPQSKRLSEQVNEVLRYKNYSLKTKQAWLCWVRFFVRWQGRNGQMLHPRLSTGALDSLVDALAGGDRFRVKRGMTKLGFLGWL